MVRSSNAKGDVYIKLSLMTRLSFEHRRDLNDDEVGWVARPDRSEGDHDQGPDWRGGAGRASVPGRSRSARKGGSHFGGRP